jgi:prepilin-type N-terminal cleavage/methylation domain-containing protein
MLKLTKKNQAFTLSEMIVVLILTSIVVGLAFSVLTLVQKQMGSIQQNFIQSTELNKLEQSLWIDFNRYSKIEYDDLYSQIKFQNEIDSTTYFIKSEYIIKERDTFNISFNEITLFFDGDIIKKGLLDGLKLETSKSFQNQRLFIFSENDANQFIN